MTVPRTHGSSTGSRPGRRIAGPVIDVEFPAGARPRAQRASSSTSSSTEAQDDPGRGRPAARRGRVRGICMKAWRQTAWPRARPSAPPASSIMVPVGERFSDTSGTPGVRALPDEEPRLRAFPWSAGRSTETPRRSDALEPSARMFEDVGIKVIDLLTPYVAELEDQPSSAVCPGVGKTVLITEMIKRRPPSTRGRIGVFAGVGEPRTREAHDLSVWR